jgi:hypothetical protein
VASVGFVCGGRQGQDRLGRRPGSGLAGKTKLARRDGHCLGGEKVRFFFWGGGVLLVFTYLAVVFVTVGKVDLYRLRRRLCLRQNLSRGRRTVFIVLLVVGV